LPGTRAPFERHQFRLTAQVVRMHSEDDCAYPLVLQTPAGNTMIAEAPKPTCNTEATACRRNQMAQARAAVKVCAKAEIMGVPFDFFHNQDGVARNEKAKRAVLEERRDGMT